MTAITIGGSDGDATARHWWHILFHGMRWAILLVLYIVILSWIVATLGAWQFQDRLRATARTAPEAYALRVNLLRAAVKFDEEIFERLQEMKAFPVLDDSDRIQLDALIADAAALAPAPVAGVRPANADAPLPSVTMLSEQLRILKLMNDQAQVWRGSAEKFAADHRLGFGLVLLDDDGKPTQLAGNYEALLAEVESAQSMELGILGRTWLLGFAEPPMRRLITWPEGHLTIMLTLLMGMLGSTLYTTRFMLDYAIKGYRLDEPAPYPTSWFVFRPLFGAATALAIYILFRAGQLMFSSDAGPGSDGAGLNPFVVAFMAIIAGLMSWQALDFIQRKGETWLASQAREPMWASGLKRLLAERQRSVAVLAAQIGRSPRQIERWLRFRDRVSPEMQERVLSALDAQPEQVFANERPSGGMDLQSRRARNLAAALVAADRTIGDVAYRLGVAKPIVEAWKAGSVAVDPEYQEELADLLDRPLDELFGSTPVSAEPVEPNIEAVPVELPLAATLAMAVQRAGMSSEQLAAQLIDDGHVVSEADVQAWVAATAPVPEAFRAAVAAALGVDAATVAWT